MAKRDPRKLKEQAQNALDKGKYKKALPLYLTLEEMEPHDGQWPRRAADMYRRLGRTQEAIDTFDRAATKYMDAGFLVKSIAICKMILQLDPTHSAVRERLSALNAKRGVEDIRRANPVGSISNNVAITEREPSAADVPVADNPATASPPPPTTPPVASPPPTPVTSPPPPPPETLAEPSADVQPIDSGSLEIEIVDDDVSSRPPPIPPNLRAPPRPATVKPPSPPVHNAQVDEGASASGKPHRRRTMPPFAPLDEIDLGSIVPGAVDIRDEGMSEGVIEIPIELDDDFAPTPLVGEAGERALRETPLLSSLGPESMNRLISEIDLVDLDPGQILFEEGEQGDTLYVVAEGAVSVFSEGPPRKHISTLEEGAFFGEIAIVTNHVRNATIEADKQRGASVLGIARNVFSNLIEEEPGVLQALLRFLRGRLVHRLIKTSPLFAPFTGPDSRALASKFRFLEVAKGAWVLEQGKRATGLYVLLAGEMEAVRMEHNVERHVGSLQPGSICGEMSMLANQPAPFSVRAMSKSFILQLPIRVFREVIMTHPQVLEFFAEMAEERQRKHAAIMRGERYVSGRIPVI